MSYTWPATKLPLPTINFGGTIEQNKIRTKMDNGNTRQRKRGIGGFATFKANWTFTESEWFLFQGVVKYKLNDGADWFYMDLPRGDGFETTLVRFTEEKYSWDYEPHMNFKVSAALETNEQCPITEEETDALLE